jgi:hypothetical protein
MTKKLLFLLIIISFIACKQKAEPIVSNPEHYLSEKEIQDFKYSIIRYAGKMPKKANQETKFDSIYDAEYEKRALQSDLLYYYVNSKNEIYFAIARIAPSVKIKKVATIGKLKKDENGEIISYVEAIRTWKMEESELKLKTLFLFERYVRNEDLTPYLPENTTQDLYIEFPDKNTSYDTIQRQWISTLFDPNKQE